MIGRFEGTTRKYYHSDMLGSTRAVTNTSNTVLEANDYYPFGHIMPQRSYLSGAATRERFTGKERDAGAGWDYFGARYYLPNIGRWMVVDPLADEYPGWSPYNYVLNNPVSSRDLHGLEPCGRPDQPPCELPEIVIEAKKEPFRPFAATVVALPVAGTAAAIDGPFPIGDAIGGTILLTAVLVDLGRIFHNWLSDEIELPDGGREATPTTNPENFEAVRGRDAKRHKETREIWQKDRFHKDHWEVYKNLRDFDKGVRHRAVWDDGRLKPLR